MSLSKLNALGIAALVPLLSGGCSTLIEVSLTSCESDSDCPEEEICGDESYCVGAQCLDNAQCEGAGEDGLDQACMDGICQDPVCEQDSDCQDLGSGFSRAICEAELCVPPQCTDDAACQELLSSESAMCEEGRCFDPLWGCLGMPDERVAVGDEASLVIGIGDAVLEEPLTTLDVKVCQKIDLECETSLPGVDVDYDVAEGLLTVTGLPQGFDGYLALSGQKLDPGSTTPQNFIPARWYSPNRPIVNDVVSLRPILMVNTGLIGSLGALAGAEVTADRGMILHRHFDCLDEPAVGVTVLSTDDDVSEEAIFFYMDESNFPDSELNATGTAGVSGFANVLGPDPQATLAVHVQTFLDGNTTINEYSIPQVPNTVTYVYLYPWQGI